MLGLAGLTPYWFDRRIHNMGNGGIAGGLHAILTPMFTHIIDSAVYDGWDVRRDLLTSRLAQRRVVDVCCGVGYSTHSLGVDTSDKMLGVARMLHPGKTFVEGNAETFGEDDAYDVATCMFGVHEMPRDARRRVLKNLLRIAPVVMMVDISTSYTTTPMMLTGEPFVLDYLAHFDQDVAAQEGADVEREELIAGQVMLWTLTRKR